MTVTATPTPVGAEIRRWRELRSLSQMALAAVAEVSTRHLSYIETGKSQPTSSMILRLADALDVPIGEQNELLLVGGFAPKHPERDFDDEQLSSVMASLRNLLDAHEPYPALLMDDHWDVIDANRPIDALLVGCHPDLLTPPINVIRLTLHPQGLAPRIRNLVTWRNHLLHQLEQRIVRSGGDPRLRELLAEVAAYSTGGMHSEPPVDPAVLLELSTSDGALRLFSMSSRIEGPADVTLDSLHLETFMPADEDTRHHLSGLLRNE